MKIYGHPWSINTRKSLMTLAETGHRAKLVLVMIPKGEQKQPDHVARHPFGKVPVLDDGEVRLFETRAINAYLARKSAPALVGRRDIEQALVDQWVNVADSYFVPHAHALIVETVFRPYLGGERDENTIANSRDGMQRALDVANDRLADAPFLAGEPFTIADIHWMPYFEYLVQTGQGDNVRSRKHLSAWWDRVCARESWQRVARSGPQPYEPGMTAELVEKQYR